MMLLKIEQNCLENLTHHIRGHSIIKFALRGERVSWKNKHTQTFLLKERLLIKYLNIH